MGIDRLAFLGILLAVPWPLWRLAASAPVRYRRRDQLALLAVLATYVIGVVVMAVGWRDLLPGAAVAGSLVVLALWWRSRPDFGGRSSIPPGRVLLHPTGPFDEVDHLERLAGRYGPIFKIGATFPVPTLTPIVCIVGHDLGLELLREHEFLPRGLPAIPDEPPHPARLPPQHDRRGP